MSISANTVFILLRGELRYHLRDWGALLVLIGLPLVFYPLALWGLATAERLQTGGIAQSQLTISAPPTFVAQLQPEDQLRVVAGKLDLEALKDPQRTDRVILAEVQAPAGEQPARLLYVGSDATSLEAKRRAEEVLWRWQRQALKDRFEALSLPLTPQEVLALEEHDIASKEQRSGNLLGRFIPLILIFLIASTALYTALDVFTLEKDRKTLETLLTTRADRRAILLAKFLVVLCFAMANGLLSLLSLAISAYSDLLPVHQSLPDLSVSANALFILAITCIPLALQLGALMTVLATYAPDSRNAQAMALPVILLPLSLGGIAAIPGVTLSAPLALLPIGNIALATREAMTGELSNGMLALVLLATGLHAFFALALARRLIGREAVILGAVGTTPRRLTGNYVPEAIGLFLLVLLLFWFLGQIAQSLNLIYGMWFSQIVLLLLPSLAMIAYLGLPVRKTLSLHRPSKKNLSLALLAGGCAPGVGALVAILQDPLLPSSELRAQQMQAMLQIDASLWVVLASFALLPAFCEEILFRGTLLGLLRGKLSPWPLCLLVGLLFGLMHMDLWRLLPTGALGILMAWSVLRSGSLWTGIIIHALNNGILLLLSQQGVLLDSEYLSLSLPIALTIGAIFAVRGMGGGKNSPALSTP